MSSDMEIKSWLIDEYEMLMRIRKKAKKENATETLLEIDSKINFIKLKLQPLELPEIPND